MARARAESISIQDAARKTVAAYRADGRRLPGLGHRVHHTVDPRTAVLFGMARTAGLAAEGIAFMEAIDASMREAGKIIPINIDGALAAILVDLGFPPPFGKLIFIIGRVAGISAEVAEEYEREKPMRIRIPVEYDGLPPVARPWRVTGRRQLRVRLGSDRSDPPGSRPPSDPTSPSGQQDRDHGGGHHAEQASRPQSRGTWARRRPSRGRP